MPTRINTDSSQVSVIGQNLSQVNISTGGRVRQRATQIAVVRQINRETIIVGGRGINRRGRDRSDRSTDVVIIRRNRDRIDGFIILGRSNRRRRSLRFGGSASRAIRDLLRIGFRLRSTRRGVLVFVRQR